MTRVAFLWHMHQPFYQDLATGEHILPWVRLHALKDYWGMVALLREFPSIRVTFNLVPSLLLQLEAFAREEAQDRHLQVGLKPADRLTEEERVFCVEQLFHAHRPRMIDPYPRYAELFARREGARASGDLRALAALFTTDDLRDLQIWHKLVWIDAWYHEHDERIRALVGRGRGFTEADKITLHEVEVELLRRVVPEYRDAAGRGQVELSTSPFYHPILPLLCDTDVHFRAHPTSQLPKGRFRHPKDAALQLARAVAFHEQIFGRKPRGLWPSEGSVSDAMIPLVAEAGFSWMATDETILARTLNRALVRDQAGHLDEPEILYRPYRVGRPGSSVACGFRDHTLSDLIGFTYASWSPGAGAEDFVRRLVDAGARCRARSGEEATIFVILDGENAWEHYEGQGRPFLRALYSRLAGHPELQAVTMSEACVGSKESLSAIFPGSWINADFYVWAGHADDHRAWGQLAEARKALESSSSLSQQAEAWATEEMLIAEGSDWFWWYGDDHSSEHDQEFDDLFRRHIRNVYRALGKTIPAELFVTNITTGPTSIETPTATGFINPVVDGEVTSYFEWLGAAFAEATSAEHVMHRGSERRHGFGRIAFGFDAERLFIRVDGTTSLTDQLASGIDLSVTFLRPSGHRLVIQLKDGQTETTHLVATSRGGWQARECSGLRAAVRTIAEVQVPFGCLALEPDASVAFIVSLYDGDTEIEPHPWRRPFELTVPGRGYRSTMWTA